MEPALAYLDSKELGETHVRRALEFSNLRHAAVVVAHKATQYHEWATAETQPKSDEDRMSEAEMRMKVSVNFEHHMKVSVNFEHHWKFPELLEGAPPLYERISAITDKEEQIAFVETVLKAKLEQADTKALEESAHHEQYHSACGLHELQGVIARELEKAQRDQFFFEPGRYEAFVADQQEKHAQIDKQLRFWESTETSSPLHVRDEAMEKLRAVFKELPAHLKKALTQERVTIAASSQLSGHGWAMPDADLIQISALILDNPELSLLVLKEEALHHIDHKLGLTDSEAWREAAAKQIAEMSPESEAAIRKALKDYKQYAHDDSSELHYVNPQTKAVELLVDYFHVRDDVALNLDSPDKINAQMKKLFPHIHELCTQFEREMAQLNSKERTV